MNLVCIAILSSSNQHGITAIYRREWCLVVDTLCRNWSSYGLYEVLSGQKDYPYHRRNVSRTSIVNEYCHIYFLFLFFSIHSIELPVYTIYVHYYKDLKITNLVFVIFYFFFICPCSVYYPNLCCCCAIV